MKYEADLIIGLCICSFVCGIGVGATLLKWYLKDVRHAYDRIFGLNKTLLKIF